MFRKANRNFIEAHAAVGSLPATQQGGHLASDNSDDDSSVSDDLDMISNEIQEIICEAKEASEVYQLLKPLKKLSDDQKKETEKAEKILSTQRARFRGLMMAADLNYLDRLQRDGSLAPGANSYNGSDVMKKLQGIELMTSYLAGNVAKANKFDVDGECSSSGSDACCPEADDDDEGRDEQDGVSLDLEPKTSQVQVKQEIHLVNKKDLDDEGFVSMKSAVTTIASTGPDQKPSRTPSLPSARSRKKKTGKLGSDFCDEVINDYIRQEQADGATVSFKTPLPKVEAKKAEVKTDPACLGDVPDEEDNDKNNVCSMTNQLSVKDSYAWPSGRRQLLPFNCDCEDREYVSPGGPTGGAMRKSDEGKLRAKQNERARKLAQAKKRAELCELPEFCPPPSAECSPPESDDDGDHAGEAKCASYIGYSPFNICLADWIPKSNKDDENAEEECKKKEDKRE